MHIAEKPVHVLHTESIKIIFYLRTFHCSHVRTHSLKENVVSICNGCSLKSATLQFQ